VKSRENSSCDDVKVDVGGAGPIVDSASPSRTYRSNISALSITTCALQRKRSQWRLLFRHIPVHSSNQSRQSVSQEN